MSRANASVPTAQHEFASGVRWGGRPNSPATPLASAHASPDGGMRPEQVAKTFGISRAAVYWQLTAPLGEPDSGLLGQPPASVHDDQVRSA